MKMNKFIGKECSILILTLATLLKGSDCVKLRTLKEIKKGEPILVNYRHCCRSITFCPKKKIWI